MENPNLVIGCNGTVAAFDAETGAELWRNDLASTFTSALATAGEDVTVLVHEGNVFAGCNGHLYCLDAVTGEIKWHNEMSGLGHNDISLSIAGKSAQVIVRRIEVESGRDGDERHNG